MVTILIKDICKKGKWHHRNKKVDVNVEVWTWDVTSSWRRPVADFRWRFPFQRQTVKLDSGAIVRVPNTLFRCFTGHPLWLQIIIQVST